MGDYWYATLSIVKSISPDSLEDWRHFDQMINMLIISRSPPDLLMILVALKDTASDLNKSDAPDNRNTPAPIAPKQWIRYLLNMVHLSLVLQIAALLLFPVDQDLLDISQ